MRKSALTEVVSLGLVAFALSPCALAQTIPVSNVEELYSAVNNSANAGATLVLAPGTYALSVKDPYDQPRPNGGRIQLQPDMSLQGVGGDRDAVVIDAYNLPASSYAQNGAIIGPNAAIRMGLGHNSLEWLSVRDGRFAAANIDVGLQPLDPGPAYVRVAHVSSSGSNRGLSVLHFGSANAGQTVEAKIVDCDFFDNFNEGVRLANYGASGSTIIARMSGNRVRGHKIGLLVVNNGTTSSSITVSSSGNRIFDNAAGTTIIGGLNTNTSLAEGNSVNFESHSDRLVDNTAGGGLEHGGLIVVGNEDISTSGGGSYNTVDVALWGVRMLGNDTWDLTAIGARSLSAQTVAHASNNHVTIEIHGKGGHNGQWQPVESFADTLPAGQNNGNSVTVIRY
jgi:hypothetical protein